MNIVFHYLNLPYYLLLQITIIIIKTNEQNNNGKCLSYKTLNIYIYMLVKGNSNKTQKRNKKRLYFSYVA